MAKSNGGANDKPGWFRRFMYLRVCLAAMAIWLAGLIIVTAYPELYPAATIVVVPTLIIAIIWYFRQLTFVKRWQRGGDLNG